MVGSKWYIVYSPFLLSLALEADAFACLGEACELPTQFLLGFAWLGYGFLEGIWPWLFLLNGGSFCACPYQKIPTIWRLE